MHCLLISALVVWLVVAENATARNIPLPTSAASEKEQQKREGSEVIIEKRDKRAKGNNETTEDDNDVRKHPVIVYVPILCILFLICLFATCCYLETIAARNTGVRWGMGYRPLPSASYYRDMSPRLDPGPLFPIEMEDLGGQLEEDVWVNEADQSPPRQIVTQPRSKSLGNTQFNNRSMNNCNDDSMQRTYTHTNPYAWDSLTDASMDTASVDTWALDRKRSARRSGAVRDGRREGRTYAFKYRYNRPVDKSYRRLKKERERRKRRGLFRRGN